MHKCRNNSLYKKGKLADARNYRFLTVSPLFMKYIMISTRQ